MQNSGPAGEAHSTATTPSLIQVDPLPPSEANPVSQLPFSGIGLHKNSFGCCLVEQAFLSEHTLEDLV